MIASRLRSVLLPVTPGAAAVRIAQATTTALRVVVAVSGPAGAQGFIAFDAGVLNPISNGFAGSGFALGAGGDQTLIVAPGQALYAIGNVAGMAVSVIESEALPLELAPTAAAPSVTIMPSVSLQLQARGGVVEISFNQDDWLYITPGGLVTVRSVGPILYVRSGDATTPKLAILGILPTGEPLQATVTAPARHAAPLAVPLGIRTPTGTRQETSKPSGVTPTAAKLRVGPVISQPPTMRKIL